MEENGGKRPRPDPANVEFVETHRRTKKTKITLLRSFFVGVTQTIRAMYDYGCMAGDIEVVLRGHAERMIRLIQSWEGGFIVVAMAWFTHFEILDALADARRRGVRVFVVVQKEDTVRVLTGPRPSDYKLALRDKYLALGRVDLSSPTVRLFAHRAKKALGKDAVEKIWESDCWDYDGVYDGGIVPVVRCVGFSDLEGEFDWDNVPRMHHKFLVFGHIDTDCTPIEYSADVVWTGSFNASRNACKSLENAVILRNSKAASAFFKEFSLLFMLSERLDWTTGTMTPVFHYH